MLFDISKEELEKEWKELKSFIGDKFADGEKINVEAILFLIGVQEYGGKKLKFEKDEKVDLMHMATCKLLEPFGYFEFQSIDADGWSHYRQVKDVGDLKRMEQFEFLQQAVVYYFRKNVFAK